MGTPVTDQDLIRRTDRRLDRAIYFLERITPDWIRFDFDPFYSSQYKERRAALRRTVTGEVLRILHKNISLTSYVDRPNLFGKFPKIGDTITVQRPARWSATSDDDCVMAPSAASFVKF